MESMEEQSIGRGYRRGGATVVEEEEEYGAAVAAVEHDDNNHHNYNHNGMVAGVAYNYDNDDDMSSEEYPLLDYEDEFNYFNHRNAKTLRTLSEYFPDDRNNGAASLPSLLPDEQYYRYYGIITWMLLSMYFFNV